MKKTETERKFLIEIPDMSSLESQMDYTVSEITQIYLNDSERTHRVRRRVYGDGSVELTENTKVRRSLMSSEESEREISEAEYIALAENIEEGSHPLRKRRVTFSFGEKTIEIDIYPEWKSSCIMEIELESEDESFDIPPFINVIREVTGVRAYSNHSMAHKMPME